MQRSVNDNDEDIIKLINSYGIFFSLELLIGSHNKIVQVNLRGYILMRT